MQIIYIPLILFLLYIITISLYRKFWNHNLSVVLQFSKHAVTEGEQTYLTEIITNQNFLPLPILQVKFQIARTLSFQSIRNVRVTDYSYINDIFCLHFFEKITRKLPVLCHARGYFTLESSTVIASGLLNQERFFMTQPQHTYLYVYPKILDATLLEVPFSQLSGNLLAKSFLVKDPFTFRGLRDYVSTDPQSTINWQAYAKTGTLKVNLQDSTFSQEVCFLLNLDFPSLLYETGLLEDSIRITFSLATMFLEKRIPVSLISNGLDVQTHIPLSISSGCSDNHRISFCEGLARIDLNLEPEHFESFIEQEAFTSNIHPVTYCLISASKRASLLIILPLLTEKHGPMTWICPTDTDKNTPVLPPNIQYIPMLFHYS